MHGYILLNTSVFTLHKQYSSKIEDITIEFLVLGIKPINNNFFSQLLKTEFSCTNNFTLQTFIQFKKKMLKHQCIIWCLLFVTTLNFLHSC